MSRVEGQPEGRARLAQMERKISALERSTAQIPSGTIIATGRTSAPDGYEMCDGTHPGSDKAGLFAAIGTRYGGTGINDFLKPNLNSGRFPRGNAGSGASGGASTHVHSTPAHVHGMAHTHGVNINTGDNFQSELVPQGTGVNIGLADHPHQHQVIGNTDGASTANTGSGGGGDTGSVSSLPPFQDVNYIIKL